MNIIGNNCGGATFYNMHKVPYSNPFMWCCTFATDMITLIDCFSELNWAKHDIIQLDSRTAIYNHYREFNPTQYGIRIGNRVDTYFTHYLYDSTAKQPYSKGPDKFYYRNYQYTYERYMERLKRMFELQEEPQFLVIAYTRHGWTNELINSLAKLNTQYKVILITDILVESNIPNIKIIYNPKLNTCSDLLPVVQIQRYYNELNSFFGVT